MGTCMQGNSVCSQKDFHLYWETKPRPRGYKTFFMLNSVEHEILNAHKYKKVKKFGCF